MEQSQCRGLSEKYVTNNFIVIFTINSVLYVEEIVNRLLQEKIPIYVEVNKEAQLTVKYSSLLQ